MTEELNHLREALRRVKYEAASLADAQVIALEALTAAKPAQAAQVPTDEGAVQAMWRLFADTNTVVRLDRAQFGTLVQSIEKLVLTAAPGVPEGWTDRHCRVAAFALHRFAYEARNIVKASALKTWQGEQDAHIKFAADAKDADEARSILLAAAPAKK